MPVSPTARRGRPLNTLRAFEAAARHDSFALAGGEPDQTPGAVSQHISTLKA